MQGIAVYPAQKIDTAAFPLKWREHEEAHVLQVSNDQLCQLALLDESIQLHWLLCRVNMTVFGREIEQHIP